MKKYIRTERANLFEPNVYISMLVKLEGNLLREEVQRAVKAAYEANETTMSNVVLEQSGAAYYEKTEKSGCKVFLDNRDFSTIIKESEKVPFALKKGELIRTYIIEETQNIVLVIHAHHLVGDGKSILVLLKDIVNRLDGKPLTYKPMVLIDKKYLLKRASFFAITKLALKRANSKWEKSGRAFNWDEYDKIHKKYWENHFSDIEVRNYSVDEVKRECPNGVTLNSYLIAKQLQASEESKRVGIAVSIREDNYAMSNQTSGIDFKFRYQNNKTLEENCRSIHKKIYKKLQNASMKYFILFFLEHLEPTLVDAVLLQTHGCYENRFAERMAKIMGYMGKDRRDIGVTNLTRIDIESEYENFSIKDILFIPPKVSYTNEVVGIATYGDKLTVCYHRMKVTS